MDGTFDHRYVHQFRNRMNYIYAHSSHATSIPFVPGIVPRRFMMEFDDHYSDQIEQFFMLSGLPPVNPVVVSSSGEQTAMKMVAPGDLTGCYYVLVCNLPFRAKWQHLKDWLREQCPGISVIVQLFNGSSCGWIRVHGRENFDAIYKAVNGGIFNGRALFASDRNATDYIHIKEMISSNVVVLKDPSDDKSEENDDKDNSDDKEDKEMKDNSDDKEDKEMKDDEDDEDDKADKEEKEGKKDNNGKKKKNGERERDRNRPFNPPMPVNGISAVYPSFAGYYGGRGASNTYDAASQRLALDAMDPTGIPSIPVTRLIDLYNLPVNVPISEVDQWIRDVAGPRVRHIEAISIETCALEESMAPICVGYVVCRNSQVAWELTGLLNGLVFPSSTPDVRVIFAHRPTSGITVWEARELASRPSATTIAGCL